MKSSDQKRSFIWRAQPQRDHLEFIKFCCENGHLLIPVAQNQTDFDFAKALSTGSVEFCGDWRGVDKPADLHNKTAGDEINDFILGFINHRHPNQVSLFTREKITSITNLFFSSFGEDEPKRIYCMLKPDNPLGLILICGSLMRGNVAIDCPDNGQCSNWFATPKDHLVTIGKPDDFEKLAKDYRAGELRSCETQSAAIVGPDISKTAWNTAKYKLKIKSPCLMYGQRDLAPLLTATRPGKRLKQETSIGFPLRGLEFDVSTAGICKVKGAGVFADATLNGTLESFAPTLTLDRKVIVNDDQSISFNSPAAASTKMTGKERVAKR